MNIYKLLSLFIFLGSFVVSCGLLAAPAQLIEPAATPTQLQPASLAIFQSTPLPQPESATTPAISLSPTAGGPGTFTPAIDAAARAQEAGQLVSQFVRQQLGVDADQVSVVYAEKTEWPDSCLGLPRTGEECVEAVTPGYVVSIQANGQPYNYHVDESLGDLRLAYAPLPEIGQEIINWRQHDDKCETASVGLEGIAFGPCGTVLMRGQLIEEIGRPQDLAYFSQTYAPFEAETPAGEITFNGAGETNPTEAEARMIAEWVKLVRLEAEAGRSGADWGLLLAWRRPNDQPGFCDYLTVDVTGKVSASTALCDGSQATDLGQSRLSAQQLQQFYNWFDTFQDFETGLTGTASSVVLAGTGSTIAAEPDQQLLALTAAEIFAQITTPAEAPTLDH